MGCLSYEKIGKVVAGGNGYGSALNQFFTDRFFVDESNNIFLLDRFAPYLCDWRFLLWRKNSSQGSLIANACRNGISSPAQDLLVSGNGTYKATGLGFGSDVVPQVRRVDGKNGYMVGSEAIVDGDKNIYSLGFSQENGVQELRRWTADGKSPENGLLIDSSQSRFGISDFFVDTQGSVYTVGPAFTAVRKWSNGKVTYLTRNSTLNRPTTVLVDSEGNIYIGESKQITVWPARSKESFPVVTFNQSNGFVVENNYRNVIQMDNNGSLYLLSTDRAIFGTKIVKYQCSSK